MGFKGCVGDYYFQKGKLGLWGGAGVVQKGCVGRAVNGGDTSHPCVHEIPFVREQGIPSPKECKWCKCLISSLNYTLNVLQLCKAGGKKESEYGKQYLLLVQAPFP